jgi:quinol monooxygenase YgiN
MARSEARRYTHPHPLPRQGQPMILTTIATFTMRAGKVPGALRLIAAVKRQAEAEQPGTLVYLVHRVLDRKTNQPTRQLYFYERYRNLAALKAHLASSSWQRVTREWTSYFEGSSSTSIKFFGVKRIAAFARPGAIPTPKHRRG